MSEDQERETPETPDTEVEQAIDDAAHAVAIQASQLEELAEEDGSEEGVGLGHLLDVLVDVTVEIGRARMSLGQLVRLAPGSLLELDRQAHEPADILVNGKIVARGEIVTIDQTYGVRVTRVES